MSSGKEVQQGKMLAQVRNAFQSACEAIDEYLNFLGEPSEPSSFVKETTFTILKFEAQKGERLGEFEVAYKASNLEDKWNHAHRILRQNNATIKNRYHGSDYEFSYWLYGEGKIYRQRLKRK